jgi:hypothetical protein
VKVRNFRLKRCARRAGGLFLGLRVHLPGSIYKAIPGRVERYTSMTFVLGLIAWTLSLDLDWNIRVTTHD